MGDRSCFITSGAFGHGLVYMFLLADRAWSSFLLRRDTYFSGPASVSSFCFQSSFGGVLVPGLLWYVPPRLRRRLRLALVPGKRLDPGKIPWLSFTFSPCIVLSLVPTFHACLASQPRGRAHQLLGHG